MTDFSELKRLAEAATPGRNFDRLPMAGGGLKYECTGDDGSLVLKVDHKNDEWGFVGDNGQADEEFFLACAPSAVLALIAENERLVAEAVEDDDLCGRLAALLRSAAVEARGPEAPLRRYGFHDLPSRVKSVVSERDQLKAENEALRKVANELRRFAACEHMHHDKPDQHEYDEPCKVLARIDVALSQGEQA